MVYHISPRLWICVLPHVPNGDGSFYSDLGVIEMSRSTCHRLDCIDRRRYIEGKYIDCTYCKYADVLALKHTLKEGDDVQLYAPNRGWYCYATFRFYSAHYSSCAVVISGDDKTTFLPTEHVRRSR